jgi:glucose dehydrogenase
MGRPLGVNIFDLTIVATILWAVWDVGWKPWALAPRVLPFFVMGLWLYLPWVRRALHAPDEPDETPGGSVQKLAAMLAIAALGAGAFAASQLRAQEGSSAAARATDPDWRHYGNDAGGTRFSPLEQISEQTVANLKPAWEYHTGDLPVGGDVPARGFAFKATPVEIAGTLYFCTPHDHVVALDAASGKEKWTYDPATKKGIVGACRGVTYAEVAGAGACPARIYSVTADARLIALDAATGRPCAGFGENGAVALRDSVPDGVRFEAAPPALLGNHLIVAGRFSMGDTDGAVRAFDAADGQLVWQWNAGTELRAPLSIDAALDTIYVATSDAELKPTALTSALVALDAASGKPRWTFQTVKDDIWNYGLTQQPVLADLPSMKGPVPALVQATKRGELFVLDRRTGKPIVPVSLRGGQPFSALTFGPGPLKESDMWGMTPFDELVCRIRFRSAAYNGLFTPREKGKASIIFPGGRGLIDWGGIAVDTDNTLVIANTSALAAYETVGADAGGNPVVHREPFLGPLGVPCTAPPWGFLHMVDLKTNKYVWSKPIGTAHDSGPLGIPTFLPFTMGTPNEGGMIVTRGNLIFGAGTLDRYLRAYDLFTGEELWKGRLPAGGQATPMTYAVNGKQFVVIAAGGDEDFRTPRGASIMAFSLP